MHHHNECAFSAEKVDQQLQEGIDREGLIDIAERVEVEGGLERHDARPRSGGVYWDHEQYSNDIAL